MPLILTGFDAIDPFTFFAVNTILETTKTFENAEKGVESLQNR